MRFTALAAIALVFVCAAPAPAQQSVKIEFNNGQVTLRAQNAPVRTILAEWARLGGATIVNGDRIAGPPVTLELTGVPERQALDIVLRSVAGYMLAPRRAGTTGASTFDRIMILPTSVAPRPNAPTAPPPAAFGAPRPIPPQPQVLRQPQGVPPGVVMTGIPDPPDEADDDSLEEELPPTTPRPTPPRVVTPPRPGFPPTLEPQIITPDDGDQDPGQTPSEGTAPTPGNPFGVPFGSGGRPGVVTPVPQQQQPQRPQGR